MSRVRTKLKLYASREFSHTVKSISMATFTPEEVEDLKAGGNGVTIVTFALS